MESTPLRAPTQLNLLSNTSSVVFFYFWLVVVCWFADWRLINATMHFILIISSPLHSKPQTVGDGVHPHAPPSRASSPTFYLPTEKKKKNILTRNAKTPISRATPPSSRGCVSPGASAGGGSCRGSAYGRPRRRRRTATAQKRGRACARTGPSRPRETRSSRRRWRPPVAARLAAAPAAEPPRDCRPRILLRHRPPDDAVR